MLTSSELQIVYFHAPACLLGTQLPAGDGLLPAACWGLVCSQLPAVHLGKLCVLNLLVSVNGVVGFWRTEQHL